MSGPPTILREEKRTRWIEARSSGARRDIWVGMDIYQAPEAVIEDLQIVREVMRSSLIRQTDS